MVEPLDLDQEVEKQILDALKEHYQSTGFWQPDELARGLMSLEDYVGRFEYLKAYLPNPIFSEASKILVSGTSVGSEIIIAKQYNFGEIYGVEVDPFLVQICEKRLKQIKGVFNKLYDGQNLPYEDNNFEVIISAHIIEHTESPFNYLKEHMRVLKYGGYFYIEFPTRYHFKELHTSLPSFEWLPKFLRNITLKLLSSKYAPVNQNVKFRYQTIIDTQLKQISLGRISYWISKAGYEPKMIQQYKPVPGIIRCLFKK